MLKKESEDAPEKNPPAKKEEEKKNSYGKKNQKTLYEKKNPHTENQKMLVKKTHTNVIHAVRVWRKKNAPSHAKKESEDALEKKTSCQGEEEEGKK